MKRVKKAAKLSSKKQNIKVSENKISFSSKKATFFAVIIISALSFFSYYPSLDNEITSWDDEFYITNNPYLKTLNSENIAKVFNTETYYMGNYHPLSMVSLSIDYAISGETEKGEINPFTFHFTNLFLHILISLLVFWFVLLLFKNFNLALIVGLLFGVHTIHVESVAWISERKDVLYSFFFMASLITYVKYTEKKSAFLYSLSLFLFLLSLFSKGQAVSLAITIILIDWFKNRTLTDIKLIVEKIPFLALAIFFGLIAIGAQKESDALIDEQAYSLIQRTGIASYAFMQYIFKLILPVNLSAIYPYPDIINQKIPSFYYLMILPTLGILAIFIWLLKKKKKILFFGIAFFIINIFLLLQFIPVGSATHADRYAYIPSIGFFILLSAFIVKILKEKPKAKNVVFIITGIYIVLLSILSFQRCNIWKNSETLWTDTTEKSPKSVVAWNNLGSFKDKQAKISIEQSKNERSKVLRAEAIVCFSKAIEGKPDYRNAYYNRGVSELELGKINNDSVLIKKSIKDFDFALAQDGQFADAYHNRGNAKAELWQLESAIKDYNIAIDIKLSRNLLGELGTYYSNRGVAKGKSRDLKGAIKDFDYALKYNPEEPSVYSNLGRAYLLTGDIKNAISFLDKSIKLDPKSFSAYLNRASAKQRNKDLNGALLDFNMAIKLNPNMANIYISRGILLKSLGKKFDACSDFKFAKKLGDLSADALIINYCK